MENPYTPGSGATPPVLVGREAQLRRAEAQLRRVAISGDPTPHVTAYIGPRGIGKTVLLHAVSEQARELGLTTAHVSLDRSQDGMRDVAAAVAEAVAPLRGPASLWQRVSERLGQFSIEVSAAGLVKAGARWDRDEPTAGGVGRRELRGLLVDAASFARSVTGGGLVVTIDEVQDSPASQLGGIARALQDATSAGAPLSAYVAGLSHTPETIMSAASFSERFDFRTLTRFDADSATIALVAPAEARGVRWDPAAVDLIIHRSGGSPFLLQRYGSETWLHADPTPARPHLTLTDARAGIAEAEEGLTSGMFRGRWQLASPAQRDLMSAMARRADPETGRVRTRDVLEELGLQKHQDLSATRARLMDKGLIEATGHGELAFTMPGFERFVAQQQTDVPSTR